MKERNIKITDASNKDSIKITGGSKKERTYEWINGGKGGRTRNKSMIKERIKETKKSRRGKGKNYQRIEIETKTTMKQKKKKEKTVKRNENILLISI